MDLVRDESLRARLVPLIAQFERESYRPEQLKEFVTAEMAQARWRALAAFVEKNGHLLVTNGPYRLAQWSPDAVELQAVREVTYPLGFGTFDRFVNPPRAVIEFRNAPRRHDHRPRRSGNDSKDGAQLQARERTAADGRPCGGLLGCSSSRVTYLIGPDGKVRNLDKMHWEDDGRFTIALPEQLAAG